MSLPEYFCWTRFGTEAGQTVAEIIDRKEQERIANDGVFLWGIGNPVGPSIRELVRLVCDPDVLFSPTRSRARPEDEFPASVVAWSSAETLTGRSYSVPPCSLVTSGYNPGISRDAHYALVCYSSRPLKFRKTKDRLVVTNIRNILSGRPVGASQVTSVVKLVPSAPKGMALYEVPLRAKLAEPYVIRLQKPLPLWKKGSGHQLTAAVRRIWESLRAGDRPDFGHLVEKSARHTKFHAPSETVEFRHSRLRN